MNHKLFLTPVPDPATKGWSIAVFDLEGKPLDLYDKEGNKLDLDKVIGQLVAHQSALDVTVEYGKHPEENWDQWKIHEKNGGGSVTIPMVEIDGVLHLGLATIRRNGRECMEFPRAFVTPGQDHFSIAVNEAKTMCTSLELAVESVGSPENSNSTWFFNKEGQGVQFFLLRVNPDNLMRSKEGWFVFKEEFEPTKDTSRGARKVLSCDFFPLKEVEQMVKSGTITDMFVPAGIKTFQIK